MSLVFTLTSSVIMMAGPQIRLLLLIFILLYCADSTDTLYKNIHTINRTASQGETVVFHCNKSKDKGADVGWRKEEILLFIFSPSFNQTVTNYTSSRMYVDPNNPRKLQISDVQPSDAGNYTCFPYHIQVQWILTVEVTESEPELHREMFLYIVPSVTGAAAVCIFCTVWIHRKRKKKEAVDVSGTRDEKAKALQTFLLHRETLTSCVYTKISPYEAALHSYSVLSASTTTFSATFPLEKKGFTRFSHTN